MITLEHILLLTLTIVVYFASIWIVKKLGIKLIHPLIISTSAIIAYLVCTDTDLELYQQATYPINFMLGPTIVSLGWVLHRYTKQLKTNIKSILYSSLIGSLVSILSVIIILRLIGVPEEIERSLVTKSVTTPIAIQITESNQGNSALATAVVIITGIFGSMIAPVIFRVLKISSPIARGVALGISSHAIGTARAMEYGELDGAASGFVIGITGVLTATLTPIVYIII